MSYKQTLKVYLFRVLLAALATGGSSIGWEVRLDAAENQAAGQTAQPEKSTFDRLLELNQRQEPEIKSDDLRRAFNNLVERAQAAIANANTPREKCAALGKLLLANREVRLLKADYLAEAELAAALFPEQKVNCLGMSALFALVGEALKLPIRAVAIPNHYFARWDDGAAHINIETTNSGADIPDETYLYQKGQIMPDDVAALGWGKSLDQHGLLAEYLEAAALHFMAVKGLDDALPLMDEAEKLKPNRSDWHLTHMLLKANTVGKRIDARKDVASLLEPGKLPPSVFANAALWLANEAAADRKFDLQRQMLLTAFPMVPKGFEYSVLHSLAFCLRNAKDYHGAACYMELAASITPVNSPEFADVFYSLAIMLKNDSRPAEALAAVCTALKAKPDNGSLKILEAGLLVATGKRDEGLKEFEKIQRPKAGSDNHEVLAAWFYAVSKQRDKFYSQFERALATLPTLNSLAALEEDPDMAVYRNEQDFKTMVEKRRQQLSERPGNK